MGDGVSHPLCQLSDGDLDLIARFVLASGSLKALAKETGVSYPTIRTRLDRVIERLQAAVDGQPLDPLAEALARFVERGQLSEGDARQVLRAAASRDSPRP